MKKLTILFSLLPFFIFGQNKIIRGNENQSSKKFALPQFSKLSVNLYADIHVTTGGMPMIELIGDANVIKHISFNINGNTLTIQTEEGFWIEKSKPMINVTVPFLSEIKTNGVQTGIGKIFVENLDVSSFVVDQVYGEIILSGKTKKLVIESSNNSYYRSKGTLNASKLIAETVKATIKGSNTAQVFAVKNIDVKLLHDANLTYEGNPSSINISGKVEKIDTNNLVTKMTEKPKIKRSVENEELTYVSVEIKNSSALRRNFVIAGPNGAGGKFSYGFPLNPFASKKENIPVGTRFYNERLGKRGKILAEISEEDNGKTIHL